MGIRLRTDVFFSDPESRVREYCEIEVYFGYDDKHSIDNFITKSDIDAANELYAMIDLYYKGTSGRILEKSPSLTTLLSKIPNKPIDSFKDNEWTEIKKRIEPVLKAMTSIHGVGVPTATKMLHLKRPQLFPVLDARAQCTAVVYDFYRELSDRAKFGIRGEKPLAVLAVLEYLSNTGQVGIRFLELLDTPYYEKVRRTYIEIAEKHASVTSPSGSWSVITGVNMELQNAIRDNGLVNQALADLTQKEIETLRNQLLDTYRRRD